jgi:endonuclease/exonuclease/phosphatase family metal-dependent hydrolase
VPRSYPLFLVALLSAGGWYFTKGPGAGKLGDVATAVSKGQYSQIGQILAAPSSQPTGIGGYSPTSNYPTYQSQPVSTQTSANYGSYAPQPVAATPATPPPPSPMFGGPAIRIASFNIQVFGDAKASKPYVMTTLAAIIQNFHVVAIQEIRTKDDYFIDNFLRTYVNTNGHVYDKVVGPRMGRTNSKEQYAFLYDTTAIEVNKNSIYTVNDPDSLLQRAPLVAMFRVRGPPPDQAFTFVLIDMHTEPDQAVQECNTLAQVYQAVRRASGGEDDIILLGDLNTDDRHLGGLSQIDGVRPIVRSTFTNTRQNAQYDNIIVHAPSTTEFTGRWGVYNFQKLHNLTLDQALQVSDHFPIWAEFSAYESVSPGRVAARDSGLRTQ